MSEFRRLNAEKDSEIDQAGLVQTAYEKLPLILRKTPEEFYKLKLTPEMLNYQSLSELIQTRGAEGVNTTKEEVQTCLETFFSPLLRWLQFF